MTEIQMALNGLKRLIFSLLVLLPACLTIRGVLVGYEIGFLIRYVLSAIFGLYMVGFVLFGKNLHLFVIIKPTDAFFVRLLPLVFGFLFVVYSIVGLTQHLNL